MAPHGEGDPAVYHSGSSKTPKPTSAVMSTSEGTAIETEEKEDGDTDEDSDDEGTLLTIQPNFNCLLLVLRDEGVLHFVKYVSAAAAASRWDICGEFEVGMLGGDENEA